MRLQPGSVVVLFPRTADEKLSNHARSFLFDTTEPDLGWFGAKRFRSIKEADAAWLVSDAYRQWCLIRDRKAAHEPGSPAYEKALRGVAASARGNRQ